MTAGDQSRDWSVGKTAPVPADEGLERAMVAGLMLEVILTEPGLPDEPRSRRRLLKSRLTASLVAHLAGRITLDRFRTLMHRLEQWFPLYYPLMPAAARPPAEQQTCPPESAGAPGLVRLDLLKEWLEEAGSEILPRRPQRKIQPDRLQEFLRRAQGGWFRVLELAQHFDIDRKTAWEYVQKLQNGGLLLHNGGRSAAVRYRLADRFLKVRLTALESLLARTLSSLPRSQVERLAAWLAGTYGEPFWEEQWPARLAADRREEIIAALQGVEGLEVVYQVEGKRLLRLPRRWLRGHED
jgi:hypothetical protein